MTRNDVGKMLKDGGWSKRGSLFRKGDVSVSTGGSDVFVTGPAKGGRGQSTVVIADVPARAIVALCESWAVDA